MSRLHQRTLPLLLIGLLAAVVVLSGCGPRAVAAQIAAPGLERSVTVLGRATVTGKPDLAMVSVGVETLAPNVGEASAQNNTKMAAVMAKLKELGIAEKDIQTSNFSINSERNMGMGTVEGAVQYRVSNMVQIKIRDLDKVGPILDAAVAAGANQVWGVNFTIEDQAALEVQAREKAVADAKSRAEALVKLAKVELGQVLAVSEGGAVTPYFYGGRGAGGAGAAMDAAMVASVSPGEVQIVYQVQATYAIK
mgnify:CR=1 FL=1